MNAAHGLDFTPGSSASSCASFFFLFFTLLHAFHRRRRAGSLALSTLPSMDWLETPHSRPRPSCAPGAQPDTPLRSGQT